MKLEEVQLIVAQVVDHIDGLVQDGLVPTGAFTYDDVVMRVPETAKLLVDLNPPDRTRVVGLVDEALRIRAGGVY